MKSYFAILFCGCALFAAEPTKKAVFACKSGDPSVFARTLDHMNHLADHYVKNKISYDIVMVAQSDCVKFMLEDLSGTEYEKEEISLDTELSLSKLKGRARFEQCGVTLERKQIPASKLRKNVKAISSATVSTVDYQLKGYAYLP